MKESEHKNIVEDYEKRIKSLLRRCDDLAQSNKMLGLRMDAMRRDYENFGMGETNIRRLIQLCHPDKHGNSKLAVEMTQFLVKMKEQT